MKDKFVNYELSERLIKIGFDEPCIATYYWGNKTLNGMSYLWLTNKDRFSQLHNSSNPIQYGFGAPLWEDAFDWFRRKYKLSGEPRSYQFYFSYYIIKDTLGDNQCIALKHKFETYKEARLSCLEKLIEIVEQNER